jgi:hypothetical protein
LSKNFWTSDGGVVAEIPEILEVLDKKWQKLGKFLPEILQGFNF